MKNKTALYVVGAIVLVLVIAGGVMAMKKSQPAIPTKPAEEEQQTDLPQVDSSVIVDLKPRSDLKVVTLSVSKIPTDTQNVEYEITYTTGAGLVKGASGKVNLEGKAEFSREATFGTCSKGVCTYDTGMTSVSLVLKFNGSKGSSQFTKDYPLQ